MSEWRAEVIINCAAFSNVDRSEEEPEEALAVNRDGAANVTSAAAGIRSLVVHFSTDYVFDGQRRTPYRPHDQPAPLNVYGISKLAGEAAVRDSGCRHLIVRTSWHFGEGSRGFVNVMRRALVDPDPGRQMLGVVHNETSRPTWVGHLAPAVLDLRRKGTTGVLHLANHGSCSRLALAQSMRRLLGAGRTGEELPRLTALSAKEFGAPARRPEYSVLDLSAGTEALGRRLPHWKNALEEYLIQ